MSEDKKPVEIKRELQPDVAEKYKLKTIRAGKYKFAKFGEIDLRLIDLKKADALVASGFQYLESKQAVKVELSEEELAELAAAKEAAAEKKAAKAADKAAKATEKAAKK